MKDGERYIFKNHNSFTFRIKRKTKDICNITFGTLSEAIEYKKIFLQKIQKIDSHNGNSIVLL